MRFRLGKLATTLLVTLALISIWAPWRRTSLQAASTPTLVQNLSTSTNQDESGNTFILYLPNPTLANNCLILALTYNRAASRTVSIIDNNGTNTWIAGPTTSSGTLTTSLYYVLGVKAGTQGITVTFDASLKNFQAVASEFYNVETIAASDGSSATSTAAAPSVAAGSFTPGTDGDLIYQYAVGLSSGSVGGASPNSGITAGPNFTLLTADRTLSVAAQYQVQAAHAAVNPTMTVGGSGAYNTVAIALKSAAAGTVPPAGIRIVHKYDGLPAMTTTVQFPSSGNLLVASFTVTTDQENISSVTDNKGNSYARAIPTLNPQMYYAGSATTGPTLTMTLVASGSSGGRQDMTLYDVTGAAAAPFDKVSTTWGGMTGVNSDIVHAPDITPSTPRGLVIALLNMGLGPPSGSIGSSAYVFDSVFYTGQTDASVMTYGEGRIHIYNTDTSPLTFGYHVHNDGSRSSWYGSAVAFKGGPTGPTAPQNFRIVP